MINVSKILFIFLLFLALAHTGWASQLADLPAGKPITLPELDSLIGRVASFMVVTSVILAVIFIIWGGITYMAAGADTTKVTEAQTRIKNGVIGAAVVLGVGVIIQTVAGIVTRDFFCRFSFLGVCIIN